MIYLGEGGGSLICFALFLGGWGCGLYKFKSFLFPSVLGGGGSSQTKTRPDQTGPYQTGGPDKTGGSDQSGGQNETRQAN